MARAPGGQTCAPPGAQGVPLPMNVALDLSTLLIVLAALFAGGLLAWFFVGMNANLTRGNLALRWLKSGLPVVADKTTLRRLGSSVIQLGLNGPRAPFKQVDILVILEPRDVAVRWLLAKRNRRSDTLILRAHLRRLPRGQFDILDASTWNGKDALAHHTPPEWAQSTLDAFLIASADAAGVALATQTLPIVKRMGSRLLRVSLRRTLPHVEIHLGAPWTGDISSEDVLNAFKEVGDLLMPS
jgi:hypothetical protein